MDAYSVLEILFLLIIAWVCYQLFFTNKKLPPGPIGLPIIGYYPFLTSSPHLHLLEIGKKFGDVFSIYVGLRRFVVLNSFRAIEEAYVKQSDIFIYRPTEFTFLGSSMDFNSLFSFNGNPWAEHRKALVSSFRILKSEETTVETPANLEEKIQRVAQLMIDEVRQTNSQPSDIYDLFSDCAVNITSNLVLSKNFDRADPILEDMRVDYRLVFQLMPNGDGFLAGPVMRLLANRFNKKYVALCKLRERQFAYIRKFVEEHKETLDEGKPRDFIDMCLVKIKKSEENGDNLFTYDKLIGDIFLYFFGGVDTMSNMLYFGLFLLTKHPEVQERCQQELEKVVGRDQVTSFVDKSRLAYCEATCSEIIRYACPTTVATARSNTKTTTISGYEIPKGTYILPSLWAATRDPNLWPNPNGFDPNNFLNRKVSSHLSLMPFSAGKRMCPGEYLARKILFIFITTLLQHFTLKPPPNEELKEELQIGFARVLKPFKVVAEPR